MDADVRLFAKPLARFLRKGPSVGVGVNPEGEGIESDFVAGERPPGSVTRFPEGECLLEIRVELMDECVSRGRKGTPVTKSWGTTD